jgi:hypothetical protein
VNAAQIAQVIHAANHALQLIQRDPQPSKPWEECSAEMRANVISGVRAVQAGLTPPESHERWRSHLAGQGWRHGPVKDDQAKTHPCMLPWADLPEHQRDKDRLFAAIVAALTREETP